MKKIKEKRLLKDLLETWGLSSLKINLKFLEAEFKPSPEDQQAAWELYIELITRTATQYLKPQDGDEKNALKSIHSLFGITREILKSQGRKCKNFTRVAIVVLNQVIRPFTTKWHKALEGETISDDIIAEFRKELKELQDILRKYTKFLSDLAGVEDLTDFEDFE